MDTGVTAVTAGGLALLFMELIKWVYRTYVISDPGYDFPAWVYAVGIPVLNVLMIPLLAFLQISTYQMPTDWVGYARGLVVVAVGSLISFFGYNQGLKPLKDYRRDQKRLEDINEVG